MSDPQFIEEDETEATVHVTVALRGIDKPTFLAASISKAAELIAAHSSRKADAMHVIYVVQGKAGVYSFDLSEVAAVFATTINERDRKSLLKKIEEYSN